MPSVKYLLIGGGLASAEAAKQIRRVDAEGSIVLVSDEPLLPYNRPPLSKEYLRGEATEALEFASAADYEELRVTTVLGSAVASLDAATSTATLDNGEVYAYEQVLLATGGSPVRLPVPGADLDGVYYLRERGRRGRHQCGGTGGEAGRRGRGRLHWPGDRSVAAPNGTRRHGDRDGGRDLAPLRR